MWVIKSDLLEDNQPVWQFVLSVLFQALRYHDRQKPVVYSLFFPLIRCEPFCRISVQPCRNKARNTCLPLAIKPHVEFQSKNGYCPSLAFLHVQLNQQ